MLALSKETLSMVVRTLLTIVLLLTLNILAHANSIAIAGTAAIGFAEFSGDFNIQGPGLSLYQATPDGPSSIGSCSMGALCNFSFSPINTAAFCSYCLFYNTGQLGNVAVQYLDPSITFTGSAVWNGQYTLSLPMIMSGTIIGYELVGCDPGGVECSLGPQEFTLHFTASGTGTFTIEPTGSIDGGTVSFSGFATAAAPEPMSLVLVGTGVLGIWQVQRIRRNSQRSET